jgi:hypothetical protein
MTLHVIPSIPSQAMIVPNKFDVLVSLGEAYSAYHIGNIRFMRLLELYLPRFEEASRTLEGKMMVVGEILAIVRSCDGRFLFKCCNGNRWEVVSDPKARMKILDSFSSLIEMRNIPTNRSSNPNKP